jgi:uncharacterized DUF497 family protein
VEFEWDADKAALNLSKHDVSFGEARTVFGDALEVTIPDPAHSYEESRFVSIGLSHAGRLLVVIYTERGKRIRIVSAREAVPKERRQYESKGRS